MVCAPFADQRIEVLSCLVNEVDEHKSMKDALIELATQRYTGPREATRLESGRPRTRRIAEGRKNAPRRLRQTRASPVPAGSRALAAALRAPRTHRMPSCWQVRAGRVRRHRTSRTMRSWAACADRPAGKHERRGAVRRCRVACSKTVIAPERWSGAAGQLRLLRHAAVDREPRDHRRHHARAAWWPTWALVDRVRAVDGIAAGQRVPCWRSARLEIMTDDAIVRCIQPANIGHAASGAKIRWATRAGTHHRRAKRHRRVGERRRASSWAWLVIDILRYQKAFERVGASR